MDDNIVIHIAIWRFWFRVCSN